MKRTLLLLVGMAAFILPSMAAPCQSGSTLAEMVGCEVTITNGDSSWTLTNFNLVSGLATNYGTGIFTAADVSVNYGAYLDGFQVTFQDGPTSYNFFNALSTSQYSQESHVVAVFSVSGTTVSTMQSAVNTVSSSGSAYAGNKLCVWTGAVTCDQTATQYSNGISQNNAATINLSNFDIKSVFKMDAVDGEITTNGYTNIFLPDEIGGGPGPDPGDVPEPMSFVLMGSGLVGVEVLRRRRRK